MPIRSDGVEKHARLLEVALEVFAAKGFHEATVAEICAGAGANVAAVNYHFGGKEQLYAEVWKRAFAEAHEHFPVHGHVPPDASPSRRLHGAVHSMLSRVLRHGHESHAGRLLLQDMARPVEAIRPVRREAITRVRQYLESVIRELLGDVADDQSVRYCSMSVVHQCLSMGFRGGRKPPSLGGGTFSHDEIDALADHVWRFSLGGIRATRRYLNRTHGVTS